MTVAAHRLGDPFPPAGVEGWVPLQREDTLLINPAGIVMPLEDPAGPLGEAWRHARAAGALLGDEEEQAP
jgi:hypothetical protein